MHRRAVLILAALLFTVPAHAADSNEQTPRILDDVVTHVAVAKEGGTFIATMDDPGGQNQPDQESYFVWDGDGALRLSGGFDPDGCSLGACVNHPLAVAISEDGSRFVIATKSESAVTDNNRLHFGTVSQGIVDVETLSDDGYNDLDITSIDMSADGKHIVVAAAAEDFSSDPNTPEPGVVAFYTWASGALSVSEEWVKEVEGPATAVDVSSDGKSANVAADHHVRFALPGTGTAYVNQGVPGKVLAVASSNSAAHRSVLGTDQGYFAIFDDSGHANPSFQEYQRRDSTSDVTAVAITEDGEQIAIGKANGNLRIYDLEFSSGGTVALVEELSLASAITDIAYSHDRKYLVIAAGDDVRFHALDDDFTLLWSETLDDPLGVFALDAAGDHVVTGDGNEVRRFTALRTISFEGQPDSVEVKPGDNVTLSYNVTNDGNRHEAFAIASAGPTEWNVKASQAVADLAPGDSITVELSFLVPEGEPADDHALALHAVLGSTGESFTQDLTAVVPETIQWALSAQGTAGKSIDAGGSVSFTALLENTGNVRADPLLTATPDQGDWSVQHDAPTSLAPGEVSLVTITAEAPVGAANLQVATITVDAGDASVDFTATVGARFDVALLGQSPAYEVDAGDEARIVLTLTNTGNTADSYTVRAGAVPPGWTVGFNLGASPVRIDNLDDGAVQSLTALVRAPANHTGEVPLQLTFTAASLGDPGQTASETVTITVIPDTEGDDDTAPTPAPGILALLGVAFLARRRPIGP